MSVGETQRLRVAAYAWVERDAAVLLVRIAPSEAGAGMWTLPGGGLEFGEAPETGVVRELREETGLEGAIGALLGVRSAILPPERTKDGSRIHAIGVLYRVSITGGALRHETDESTDRAEWIPYERLDGLSAVPLVAWARTTVGR